MKKYTVIVFMFFAINVFASMSKVIYFGMVDRYGEEYTSESIVNVTYIVWLQRIPGEVIEPSDGLAQCDVVMFPDPETPLRGACVVNLQHFSSWNAGDVLHIIMKDYNDVLKRHCEAYAEYTIQDTSTESVYLGFEDLGLEDSGMPWLLSIPTGYSETKTFVYPCVTTTGTDYNFVGLPVETGWTEGSDFDPTGENIESVTRFDAVNQGCETGVYSSVFGWCKDIPIQTGGAYMINIKNNFDFTVTGDSVNVAYDLITTTGTDLNCIVHPLTKAALTTTEELGNDIGTANCNSISKWNNTTQLWQGSSYSIFGWIPVYTTEPATPLMVNMKQNLTWPAGKADFDDNSENEMIITEKNAKGNPAKARIIFYHVIKQWNDEDFVFPDELSGDTADKLRFKAYITSRPAEVLTQDSFDCGYLMIGTLSVVYINTGNFTTSWVDGDQLRIEFPYFGDHIDNYDVVTLGNESGTIYRRLEPYYAGSGAAFEMPLSPSGLSNEALPSEITLHQNYPNPFNPETEISFSLPREEQVTLSVFNSDGQLVKELVKGRISAGNHSVNFNAENLNSGIYFYTLEAGSSKLSKKMLLIK
ncbi:TPA: hypothetical protein DCR49_08010 [Candidatus Delongbacteria bacterium]|nr:hypothetical protein [Candidatus Delongbacteria bacterium]